MKRLSEIIPAFSAYYLEPCATCTHPKTAHLMEANGCTRIICKDNAGKMICPCTRQYQTPDFD